MTPEKRKKYMIEWRSNHPEKVIEYETRYTEARHKYRLKYREKYKTYNKEYRKKNADRLRQYSKLHSRNTALKRKYGITAEDYDAMFLRQNGQCASCQEPQEKFKRRFHVDHNHSTGNIRGLLCLYCNHLAGFFRS